MSESDPLPPGAQAARLAFDATEWMIDSSAVLDADDPSLYHGLAGALLALHEAHEHFDDDRYGEALERGADSLSDAVDRLEDCSLYFGLAGVAITLRGLGRVEASDVR